MKFKSQPRIKGIIRDQVGAGVLQEIDKELRRLSKVYGVSRSWIIATVLADAFKIGAQPRYYETKEKKRGKAA